MSTTNIFATKDTYVNKTSPSTNYGTATTMIFNPRYGNAAQKNLLLYFPLDSTFPATSITTATVYIYQTADGLADADLPLVARVDASWGETTVTWDNQPGVTGSTYNGFVMNTTVGWHTFTITTIANLWLTGTTNDGIKVYATSDLNPNNFTFSTREGANAPYLALDYVPKARGGWSGVSMDNAIF